MKCYICEGKAYFSYNGALCNDCFGGIITQLGTSDIGAGHRFKRRPCDCDGHAACFECSSVRWIYSIMTPLEQLAEAAEDCAD